ncbi:MAG: hypothetical protein GY861_01670, partial [bacterium]|nr:hypothetical protein [bacterium]
FSPTGVGLCLQKAFVNGEEATFVSDMEIDLWACSSVHEIGDVVEVLLIHQKDCRPVVLNPYCLVEQNSCKVLSFKGDSSGTLYWTAVQEEGEYLYIVQQYYWNKWNTIAEVKAKGAGQKEYVHKAELISGVNKYRIKQVNEYGLPFYSDTVQTISTCKPIKLESKKKVRNQIVFSDTTKFSLYDAYGNELLVGKAKTVDCSQYSKGDYYISFGNTDPVKVRIKRR